MEKMMKNELIVSEVKGTLSFAEREVIHLRRNLAVDNISNLKHGLDRIHEILWAIEAKVEGFDTSSDDELF